MMGGMRVQGCDTSGEMASSWPETKETLVRGIKTPDCAMATFSLVPDVNEPDFFVRKIGNPSH